ncbi:hypothetical protein EV702DRAFT_1041566 [Suillus placidus]|uniref:Uncharacterized protein n=1 Tax=Suillus placidus TaxID=48579 RepID=A0A9P7A6Y3_9AGAM|nr:hypothetical protein EV702DRAFT_1041566 [Suillus placidus]
MSYHCDADPDHHALEDAFISTLSLGHPPFESGSLKPSEDVSESMVHVNSDIVLESCHHGHNGATTVQKSEVHSGHLASLNMTSKTDREVVACIMIHREKVGTDWQSVFDIVKYGEEKQAAMVSEKRAVA